MKTLHHIALALFLFLVYVWLVQHFYLFLVRDECQDLGGLYQPAHALCSGLLDPVPDYGASMSFHRWLIVLGIPAGLMAGLHISVYALVSFVLERRRAARRSSRRR